MADFLLLKGTHVLVVGQQKLSGNPSWLHGAKPVREHVEALGRSPDACAASSAAESAVTEGRVAEMKYTATSLRKDLRSMVVNMVS